MKVRKLLIGIICTMFLLLLPLAVSAAGDQDKPLESGNVTLGDTTIPQLQFGKKVEGWEIKLINNERVKISNVIVTMTQNENVEVYPFEIRTNVFKELREIGKTEAKKFEFGNLTVKKDVATKDYPIQLEITYTKNTGSEEQPIYRDVRLIKTIIVPVTGNPELAKPEPTASPEPTPEETEIPPQNDGGNGGGTGSGGDAADDNGKDKKTTTPRVIVNGFRTEPAVVNAGDTFKLILQVRNTSQKTEVKNMEINLAGTETNADAEKDSGSGKGSDAFMPVKGSSTLFVESIGVGKTKEVAIDLTARADLSQKPYPIQVSMKYENSEAGAYEASSNISIPVKQKARLEVSAISVDPESIKVGEEGGISFSINNMGRTKLYNVKASAQSPAISSSDVFIGNIESGATGNAEMMVTGVQETQDAGEVKLLITYEDQDGNSAQYEAVCTLFVTPPMDGEMNGMMNGMPEEVKGKGKLNIVMILAIAGGVVAVALIVTVVIVKRKHKKKEEFADEVFGSDTDE